MKKFVLGFLLLNLTLFCFGLPVDNSKDNFFKDYVSRIWNSEDGIPGNSITDVLQDKNGYILFGTYGGVIRFDGVKFLTLNKSYNEKYNFFSARSIMEDSKGNLWVGSNDEGAFCVKDDGDVLSFTSENGLPNNSIRSFCEDNDGNIWIGTASGVACVSSEYKIIQLPGFDTIPNENKFIVTQIYCDTAGRIWIITRGEKGLYKYEDHRFMVYEGITSIDNPIVTTMTQDSNDAYWFGVAPYYAVRISGNEEKLYNISTSAQRGTVVNCIYQDSAKQIWFGMDNGITILHDGEFEYYTKEKGLSEESVVKIIEDKEKNIWIGTDRGGLQKLSYGKFQTTSMPTSINAIAQDTNRKVIWIAGDNGLYCYKNNKFEENEITEYCKNVRIRHLSITKEGALLISCYEKYGQLKVNLDGTIEGWTKNEGIAGDRVRVAEQISNGDLYIGTTTGLTIIDGKTREITNITKGDNLDNDYIMCLYEDKDGTVWCGTDGGGLFILKDKQIIKTITKDNNLVGNVVFKISGYGEDEKWVTTGTGISRIKDDKIFNFTASNGFGSDGIFQVIPDFSGRLWGTSNRGIFYVKLSDIENVISGRQSAVYPKYFNRLDGITSGGVTSTSLSMKDDLGRIWFTLIDGFTVFDPVRNASKSFAPEVKIEDVYIDNEKVDISNGVVELAPSVKRLKIDFTGISFISSEQILFKTKLDGFEEDFTDWNNARSCTYTNLRPGTYTFYVRAESGDEVLCQKDAVITVIKKPYLWERPWFDVLVIVLILSIIALLIFRKINSLKKQKESTENLLVEVIQALVETIDAKDKYTKGHSRRVANYSVKLAKAMGFDEQFRKEIYYSGLLHDIGKIGIPDSIINKEGKLTKEEYDIVKTHPETGSKILSSISIMPNITVGARSHHECYDGKGYPDGIAGENIPLLARIIKVADAYDAMTSNRSYRSIMNQKDVRNEIEKNLGTQFDPIVGKKMLEIIDADYEYDLKEKI